MKQGILAIFMFASTLAFAGQVSWQDNLAAYQQRLSAAPVAELWSKQLFYTVATVTACGVDAVGVLAVTVADTTPVVNGAVEIVTTYPNYSDAMANLTLWNAAANTTRGTVGGAVVGVTDTIQFIVDWLSGDTSQSYQQLAKTYGSTIALAEKLFAEQGECMMFAAKTNLAGAEIARRNSSSPADAGSVIVIQP